MPKKARRRRGRSYKRRKRKPVSLFISESLLTEEKSKVLNKQGNADKVKRRRHKVLKQGINECYYKLIIPARRFQHYTQQEEPGNFVVEMSKKPDEES
ncbi:MAG: hypothetical protein AAF824_04625 [Bacteroidota bacterium]